MVSIFKQTLSSKEKEFEFTSSSLRGAKDIFKLGGHSVMNYKDQKFRMHYDNRRAIVCSTTQNSDVSNQLFESKPWVTAVACSKARFVSKIAYKLPYLQFTPLRSPSKSKYRSYIEIAVRNFIKGYLSNEPCFGLKGTEFKRYNDLISFIRGFDPLKDIKLTRQSVSQYKSRNLILRPVIVTRENIAFADFVVSKLPYFDKTSFLKT